MQNVINELMAQVIALRDAEPFNFWAFNHQTVRLAAALLIQMYRDDSDGAEVDLHGDVPPCLQLNIVSSSQLDVDAGLANENRIYNHETLAAANTLFLDQVMAVEEVTAILSSDGIIEKKRQRKELKRRLKIIREHLIKPLLHTSQMESRIFDLRDEAENEVGDVLRIQAGFLPSGATVQAVQKEFATLEETASNLKFKDRVKREVLSCARHMHDMLTGEDGAAVGQGQSMPIIYDFSTKTGDKIGVFRSLFGFLRKFKITKTSDEEEATYFLSSSSAMPFWRKEEGGVAAWLAEVRAQVGGTKGFAYNAKFSAHVVVMWIRSFFSHAAKMEMKAWQKLKAHYKLKRNHWIIWGARLGMAVLFAGFGTCLYYLFPEIPLHMWIPLAVLTCVVALWVATKLENYTHFVSLKRHRAEGEVENIEDCFVMTPVNVMRGLPSAYVYIDDIEIILNYFEGEIRDDKVLRIAYETLKHAYHTSKTVHSWWGRGNVPLLLAAKLEAFVNLWNAAHPEQRFHLHGTCKHGKDRQKLTEAVAECIKQSIRKVANGQGVSGDAITDPIQIHRPGSITLWVLSGLLLAGGLASIPVYYFMNLISIHMMIGYIAAGVISATFVGLLANQLWSTVGLKASETVFDGAAWHRAELSDTQYDKIAKMYSRVPGMTGLPVNAVRADSLAFAGVHPKLAVRMIKGTEAKMAKHGGAVYEIKGQQPATPFVS